MSPATDAARIPFPSASSSTPNGLGSRQQSQTGLAAPTSNSATLPRRSTNLSRPSPLSRLHSSPVPNTQETPRSEIRPSSFKAPPSPCYVHSHLEKYGHLPPEQPYFPWSSTGPNTAVGSGHMQDGQRKAEDGQPQIRTQKVDPFGGSADKANSTTQGGLQKMKDPCETGEISPGLSAVSTFSSNDPDGPSARHRLQVSAPAWEDLDDAEDGGSITRQLAETATGVREMSKQLGRTKVKSNIQHVLIVTKARDNGLIKLTREVAVYLMNKKTGSNGRSNGNGRGMVVYVDAQLRTSKRFNAAGLERERPEFFKPLPRRRASSSASVHTLSTSMSDVSLLSRANSSSGAKRRSDVGRDAENEQGQLRYWTADMCSNTPNLFDFVVTVRMGFRVYQPRPGRL
jgi:NAD+ kinase